MEIVIFCILFPCSLLLGIKRKVERNILLTKEDSNYMKGIAAMMVVFAHYCVWLEEEVRLAVLIKPFQYLGPLGVAIFMFLSGYGIYRSNKLNKLDKYFLWKRLKQVYIPYLIIRFIFAFTYDDFSSLGKCIGYFLGVTSPYWFIIVIMLMYILYYLVSKINIDEVKKISVLMCLIILMSVALYFQMGIEKSYWFGNNILFPIGVIVGKYESCVINLYKKKWFSLFCITFVGLGCTCVGYFVTDGLLQIAIKTLMGILLVSFILMLLEKIEVKKTLIVLLGNYSLYVYLTHNKLFVLMKEYLVMENVWAILLYYISVLLVPIVLKYIIDLILRRLDIAIRGTTRKVY